MAKLIGFVLIAVYAVWFFTVYTVGVPIQSIEEQEIYIMKDSGTELKLTQAQMHNTIKNTAEKEGWSTTEFKNNALIAEKTTGDNSISVTVTFSKLEFSISPENIDLQNAINSALNI